MGHKHTVEFGLRNPNKLEKSELKILENIGLIQEGKPTSLGYCILDRAVTMEDLKLLQSKVDSNYKYKQSWFPPKSPIDCGDR